MAFDELVNRHHRRIHQLVHLLTRGGPDTEDLTQETFIRAFRGLARFRGTSSFSTWLHRIAINVVKTHAARSRARGPHQAAAAPSQDDRPEIPSPSDVEGDVARRLVIDRALAGLPPDLRVLVTLRDVFGFEYQEIASMTGHPVGTVASGVFRARRRLRPMLAPLLHGRGSPNDDA